MAKKKINVRKDYSYKTKKSPPKYDRAGIARKNLYLILRGPDLNATQIIEENEELKEFAARKSIKLKFLQAKDEADFILKIKDGNVWAAGIVHHLGSLNDEDGKIKTALQRILISSEEVREDGSYIDSLQKLLDQLKD